MRLVNKTRYSSRSVRRIVADAMGEAVIKQIETLAVYIRRGSADQRRGGESNYYRRDKGPKLGTIYWTTEIWLSPAKEYPIIAQLPSGGKKQFADWPEELYHTAAHEAHHILRKDRAETKANERAADQYAGRKLAAAMKKYGGKG